MTHSLKSRFHAPRKKNNDRRFMHINAFQIIKADVTIMPGYKAGTTNQNTKIKWIVLRKRKHDFRTKTGHKEFSSPTIDIVAPHRLIAHLLVIYRPTHQGGP